MRTIVRQSVLFYVVVAWLPVSAGLFRIWVHQDAIQQGYALSAEETRRERLRETSRELEVEVAAARSPARLTHLAANLGLKAPIPGQLIGVTKVPHLAQADVVRSHNGRP